MLGKLGGLKGGKAKSLTPMQAGLIKRLMSIEDIVNLVPEEEQKKRGSYKKKNYVYLIMDRYLNLRSDIADKFHVYAFELRF